MKFRSLISVLSCVVAMFVAMPVATSQAVDESKLHWATQSECVAYYQTHPDVHGYRGTPRNYPGKKGDEKITFPIPVGQDGCYPMTPMPDMAIGFVVKRAGDPGVYDNQNSVLSRDPDCGNKLGKPFLFSEIPAQAIPPAQVAPPNSFNAKVATELAEIEARLQQQPQQSQQPQPPAPVNVTQQVNTGGSGEAVSPMSCGLLQDILVGCPYQGFIPGYNVVYFGGRPFYGRPQAAQVTVVNNVNVSSNSSVNQQQPQPRQPHPTPNPPKSGGGTLPPTGGSGGGTNPPTGGSGGGTTGPTGGGTRPTPQFHQAPASPRQGGMSNGGFSTASRGSYSGGGGRGGGHR